MTQKTHFIKAATETAAFDIPVTEFDELVDQGFELITITTPKARYVSSIDDWLDFGYLDLTDSDVEVRTLHTVYMGKS
jgi:hypothetical protein